KRAYCLKTQPATGETYPKSDLFNKAPAFLSGRQSAPLLAIYFMTQAGLQDNSERQVQKQKLTLTLLCLQSTQ
ncbi:hypothetical protein C4Z17_023140, partial [Enterobacter hormaechei subsp. steigerwaltii]|uniref:hypothetical protein n=1 Tax=Enterobacter hormaechei TaxID=158836 RepID=UPI000D4ADBAF